MKLLRYINIINKLVYTRYWRKRFNKFGKSSTIAPYSYLIEGACHISVGENVCIGGGIQLTAWVTYGYNGSDSIISIADGSNIGSYNHITAINGIKIGTNVLTGKYVTITDNSHGETNISDLRISPMKRKVCSKGRVVIGNNVWIGDKVTILPNVNIGEGSIVGANSVVTKSIPPYSVAVGNPARIIKQLNNHNNE